MTNKEENIFDKFYFSNTLDLATAFWVFGVFGSVVAGFIFGYLSEAIHWVFTWVYFAIILHIIIALGACAETHKKKKLKNKESAVWAYLTLIYCGLGFLGLVKEVIFFF